MADDPENAPETNPEAEELARLRQEKKDREDAERKAEQDELSALRQYKTEQETKKDKAVKAPTPRAEKVEEKTVEKVTTTETPKPELPRSGVSKKWFGNHA